MDGTPHWPMDDALSLRVMRHQFCSWYCMGRWCALRREQIKLQVALITPLIHVRGYAAPETKAAAERARLLIEEAEALGEPPEDPLLLFSVLFGLWAANVLAFNGDVCLDLAAQFLTLAEKQGATAPLMVGHRNLGVSLFYAGDIAQSRVHCDRAIALYDPTEHRPLATRFAADVRVVLLSYRSWALWLLGYPEAALTASDDALKNARETGQAATLLWALYFVSWLHIWRGDYAAANPLLDEAIALADERCFALEGGRNDEPRLAIGLDRQSPERSPNDDVGDCRVAMRPSSAISSSLSQSISKRVTESELWVWASCRLESEPLAWAAIRQPVKQLRSRQARKSHFVSQGFEDGGLAAGLAICPTI